MRRLALAPTLVCALLSSPAAHALGVGEIELQSALNQPLDAEIPLRGVAGDDTGDVIVTLASEEAFRDLGLARPYALTRLEFDVVARDGTALIQISSREPISEPFLNFLIEVDAPDGNLLREYTVLLDPPVFASNENESSGAAEPEVEQTPGDADASMDDAVMNGEVGSVPPEPSPATPETNEPAAAEAATGAEQSEAAAEEPAPARVERESEREGEFGDTPVFLQVAREEEEAERQQREQRRAEREAEADAAQAARAPATPVVEEPSQPREYGEVAEGETLWDIAEQLREGDTSVQQMMLALLRYNPEAFEDGNINRLKQGYVLRVPEEDDVRSLSGQRAIARVREQNGLWREWRDAIGQGEATQVAQAEDAPSSGDEAGDDRAAASTDEGGDSRLDLVGAEEGGATSDESASATASDSTASQELKLAREELASVQAERTELADRVAQLEDTVDKMEQLVTVREDQLAQLQQQLSDLQAGSGSAGDDEENDEGAVVAAAPGDAGSGAAAANGGGESGGNESVAGGAGDSGVSAGAENPEEGSQAQTTASDEQQDIVGTDTDDTQRGWLGTVLGVFAGIGAAISGAVSSVLGGGMVTSLLAGAVALLVLGLALVLVRRRRANAAAEEAELAAGIAATQGYAAESEQAVADDAPADPEPVASVESPSALDDTSVGLFDDDLDLSDLGPEAPTGDESAPRENDDTLDEADVYLAYGLHQQAEDLLRLALQENPTRADYHEKLLETLFAAGKADEFATAAHGFRQQVGEPSASSWQRVVGMGQQIAPQHALFASGAGAVAGASIAGEHGSADDDLDLGGDGDSPPQDLGGDDLGLGGNDRDLDTPASTSGSSTGGADDDDLDFDLSDLDDADQPGASPASLVGASGNDSGLDDAGLDFDISDLGPPEKTGAGEGPGSASEPEASASHASDGLDFDIGDLGDFGADRTSGAEVSPGEASTTAGPADDDDLDFSLDTDLGLGETSSAAQSAADDDVFDLSQFEVGDDADPATATDTTGDAGADLTPSMPPDNAGASDGLGDDLGLGMDEGETPVMEFDLDAFEQGVTTDEGGASGAGSPSSDAAGGASQDEGLATMLDLAKAYIDMGDADSASNALEEVIAGGTEEQQAEARNLLETVQ